MKPADKKYSGAARIAAGAVMISFSPVFVKIANIGASGAAFYRMLFGAGALFLTLILTGGKLWQGKKHFLLCALCGIVFTADLILWHKCIYYTGPGLATLLSGFQVFFLLFYDIAVMKKKIAVLHIAAIILAVCGLYFIVGTDWHAFTPAYRTGVIFGLITALCYAVYIVVIEKAGLETSGASRDNLSTLSFITMMNLFFITVAGFLMRESFVIPDAKSFIALAGYGIVSQFLAWTLITAGLPGVLLSRAGLILLLQPVLAFVWDILFFSRALTFAEAAGIIMALVGIYLGSVRANAYGREGAK